MRLMPRRLDLEISAAVNWEDNDNKMPESYIRQKDMNLNGNREYWTRWWWKFFKNWKPIGEVGCCESRMAVQRH